MFILLKINLVSDMEAPQAAFYQLHSINDRKNNSLHKKIQKHLKVEGTFHFQFLVVFTSVGLEALGAIQRFVEKFQCVLYIQRDVSLLQY